MKQALGKPMMRSGMAAVRAAALCLGALAGAAHSHAQCQYSVTVLPEIDCGLFGGPPEPIAVNNLGHVAAYGYCNDNMAVLWTGGATLTFLPRPPGYAGARAEDLNDLDEVVGSVNVTDGNPHACLWRGGQPILLGIPKGGNFSVATGINNRSEICGYWGHNVTGPMRAFIWRKGVMTDLVLPHGPNSVAEDINDRSQITGWMGDAPQSSHCFLWTETESFDLGPVPGGDGGRGTSIGRNGMISGWGTVQQPGGAPSQARSSQWYHGQVIDLGMLPKGLHMRTRGGNAFATVGYCDRPDQIGDRGFLFQNGLLHDLSNLAPGFVIGLAQDVNDRGQIAVRGRPIGGAASTFVLSPIDQIDGDISHDCQVNVDDLIAVILEWGETNSYADANSSGSVEVGDLIMVIENWTL